MNWDVIAENLPLYVEGAKLTLLLAFTSLTISFVIAVPLAFLRNSKVAAVRYAVIDYTLIFRGTPLLAQLFLVYFGLAQFGMIRSTATISTMQAPSSPRQPCVRAIAAKAHASGGMKAAATVRALCSGDVRVRRCGRPTAGRAR